MARIKVGARFRFTHFARLVKLLHNLMFRLSRLQSVDVLRGGNRGRREDVSDKEAMPLVIAIVVVAGVPAIVT